MSAAKTSLDVVVRPDPADAEVLEQLAELFDREGYRPCLIGPDASHVDLPVPVYEVLASVVRGMAAGQTMTIAPSGRRLTTQQAAEMLHMSRPHLVKLLDRGELPFDRVGTHRRVKVEDVLAYRRRRALERERQLDELSQLSQDIEGDYR